MIVSWKSLQIIKQLLLVLLPHQHSQSDYKALFGLLQKMNLQNISIEADHGVNQIHVARERGDDHTTNSGTEGISYALSFSSSKIHASWLVDSGATDHICQTLRMFDSYDTIKPFTVRLSNGISVLSNIAGTVKIMDNFVLFDVLYLRQFQYNLLYF